MPAPALHFPVRVPDDLLLALGEHTGVFWSDSLGMAPFVCEAIRNYINPPPPPQLKKSAGNSGAFACSGAAYCTVSITLTVSSTADFSM